MILWVLLAGGMFGCSSSQQLSPSSEISPDGKRTEDGDSLSFRVETEDPFERVETEDPFERVEIYLQQARAAQESGKLDEAQRELDSASGLLSRLEIDEETDPEISEQFLETVKILEGEYRKILPDISHLSPDSPLSLLLESLSEEHIQALSPDAHRLVTIKRIAGECDLPIEYNPKVERCIQFFQTKGREIFLKWLSRSGKYMPMIQKLLEEEGVPRDLVYLAMVESGFNPKARSWARAVGIWQFIGHTGRMYGLRRDWWMDERRDPVKSTRAAAKYLNKLHQKLGDWKLAMAAYNAGLGRVKRAIRKADSRDFWKLGLPRETRNYVPLFMAALLLSKEPETFGFNEIEYQSPLMYDEVALSHSVDLRVAAAWTSVPYQEIKSLNPELSKHWTPPHIKPYLLKLPKGTADRFRDRYARAPDSQKVDWHRHKVRKGESLYSIARRFKTSQRAISDANSIRNVHRIRAGQNLLIPVPLKSERSPRPSTRTASRSVPRSTSSYRRVEYIVKKGDTLSEIAEQHHVRVSSIKKWNRSARRRYLYPGNRLVLFIPKDRPEGSGRTVSSTYLVKKGDTLWSIARRFNRKVEEIASWNDIRNYTRIYPGTRLIVQNPQEGEAGRIAALSSSAEQMSQGNGPAHIYVVKRGDTLWSIARSFGLQIGQLIRWNDIKDERTIYPGDRLTLRPK